MNHQVACNTSTILFPAPPPGKDLPVERDFRGIIKPRVPVNRFKRKVLWNGILPGTRGIVSAKSELDMLHFANSAPGVHLPGFPAEAGADPLRTYLNYPVIFVCCLHHREALGDCMR